MFFGEKSILETIPANVSTLQGVTDAAGCCYVSTRVNQTHLTRFREGFRSLMGWIIKHLHFFWHMLDHRGCKMKPSEETWSPDNLRG